MEDHQHSKTSVHAIVIALAILNAVGMLVLYFKIDLLSSEIRLNFGALVDAQQRTISPNSPTTKTPNQDAPTPKIQAWASYENSNLKFKDPESWTVASYEDEFVQGQQNVRITSSPGVLADPNDPGQKQTDPTTFKTGFQATIRELAAGQDFGKMDDTEYPHIKKLTFQCIDYGCPAAEYLFFGAKNAYHIAMRYNADDTQGISFYQAIGDTFLASLHE